MHSPFIMTLIAIAGGLAVPTLACAENPPAAIDSYVATFTDDDDQNLQV